MTLQASGTITAAQVSAELGTASFDMNRTNERELAGVSSGSYNFEQFYGQTSSGAFAAIGAASVISVGSQYSTTISLGTPAWNRWILLSVVSMNNTTPTVCSISSCTINGINMAAAWQVNSAGTSAFSNYCISIVAVLVPTGTTGTLIINYTDGNARWVQPYVYRATGVISFVSAPGMFHEQLTSYDGGAHYQYVTSTNINLGSTNSCLLMTGVASCSSAAATAFTNTGIGTTDYEADYVASVGGRWCTSHFTHGGFSASWPIGQNLIFNGAGRLRTVALSFYLR